jgi:hypothetical protein
MSKRTLLSSLVCLAVASAVPAALGQSDKALHFRAGGFSIAPLDSAPGDTLIQPLIMCLPARDGFAANVNVQIQPFKGKLEEYSSLTIAQLKTAGLTLLQYKTAGKSAVTYEYSGTMQGRVLHYYQRAEKSGDSVYLTTATAPDDEWTELGPRLKFCVDSCHPDASAQRPSSSSPAPAPPGR